MRLTLIAVVSLSLWAQGTSVREDAGKYGAHTQMGNVGLGADFWGTSMPVQDGALASNGHLVVEVAFFAPPNRKVAIKASEFILRVDGRRIYPDAPGSVTLGYAIPDYRQRGPRVEADGQAGPVIVSAGGDPTQRRFPGDNNPADIPLPPREQGTDPELRKDPIDPVKAVNDAALPEGLHATPISGYLFYAYRGKLKHIKKVELEYAGPLGTAALSLR